jgi:hypothetical protein
MLKIARAMIAHVNGTRFFKNLVFKASVANSCHAIEQC